MLSGLLPGGEWCVGSGSSGGCIRRPARITGRRHCWPLQGACGRLENLRGRTPDLPCYSTFTGKSNHATRPAQGRGNHHLTVDCLLHTAPRPAVDTRGASQHNGHGAQPGGWTLLPGCFRPASRSVVGVASRDCATGSWSARPSVIDFFLRGATDYDNSVILRRAGNSRGHLRGALPRSPVS